MKYDPIALIEQYVRGMEITVGVLGNPGEELEALPVIEIVPKAAFYDYESKYAEGGSEHLIPARLPAETVARTSIRSSSVSSRMPSRRDTSSLSLWP